MQAAIDTTADAERVQFEIWARMSASERSGRALLLSQFLMQSSRALLDKAHPHLSSDERTALYVTAQYGEDLGAKVLAHLKALPRNER